jgi:hypothetical protein
VVGEQKSCLHGIDSRRYFQEHEHGIEDSFVLNVGPVEFKRYVLIDKFFNNLYIPHLELIQIIIFLLFLFP